MNRKHLAAVFTILIFAGGILLAAARAATHRAGSVFTASISELSWIAGAWQSPSGERAQIEEYWTQPAGGAMVGLSRTVVGEKTVEFEYLRIEQRGADVFYIASPGGRCPATDFKLTRVSSQEAVFENPQHDFPKRIIYRRNSDGSLTASIDAGEGTKAKSFPYVRAR